MTKSIPDMATTAQLDSWMGKIAQSPTESIALRGQVSMAAMGYLGMCRHEALSPDWIAHNTLWVSTVATIAGMLDPSAPPDQAARPITRQIRETFERLGYRPNDVTE